MVAFGCHAAWRLPPSFSILCLLALVLHAVRRAMRGWAAVTIAAGPLRPANKAAPGRGQQFSTLSSSLAPVPSHIGALSASTAPRRNASSAAKRRAPLLVAGALIVLWVAVTQSGLVAAYALPKPATMIERLVFGFQTGYLGSALWQTLREALWGCFFAGLIGIPFGFAIAHFRTLARSTEPYLAASQAIPAIAIAPLLVTWVGYGTMPIVILCMIMVIFPVIISTAVGVRQIDRLIVDAARLDGAGGLTLIHRIELPLAGPNILAGVRTGFTLAMTGAVVGEMVIGGERGLGIQLITAQHVNDTPGMFAVIVLLAAVAMLIYGALKALENRVVAAVSD